MNKWTVRVIGILMLLFLLLLLFNLQKKLIELQRERATTTTAR